MSAGRLEEKLLAVRITIGRSLLEIVESGGCGGGFYLHACRVFRNPPCYRLSSSNHQRFLTLQTEFPTFKLLNFINFVNYKIKRNIVHNLNCDREVKACRMIGYCDFWNPRVISSCQYYRIFNSCSSIWWFAFSLLVLFFNRWVFCELT